MNSPPNERKIHRNPTSPWNLGNFAFGSPEECAHLVGGGVSFAAGAISVLAAELLGFNMSYLKSISSRLHRLAVHLQTLRLLLLQHRRQVLSIAASLLIQTACLLVLALVFFPLLTPGSEITLDGNMMDMAANSEFSLSSVADTEFLSPSDTQVMSVGAASQISVSQPASGAVQVAVGPTSETVSLPEPTLANFSDAELLKEVPVSINAMPIHRHRGTTRVEEATSTTSVAATLKGELKSISEDGDAVVVWMLDQSLSMQLDIKNLARDLNETLLEIERDKTTAMTHYVVAFGSDVRLLQNATDDGQAVANAIFNLPPDLSGIENTFQATEWCVANLLGSPRWRARGKRLERQKLLVIWTDESGDDYLRIEQTIQTCLAANVRVDIIGPSAVLGAQNGFTAYTHPENNVVYQLPVHRGPDSAYPQKLSLGYWYRGVPSNYDELTRGPWPGSNVGMGGSNFDTLLSGFSPYALTRLARQTGGRYTIFDRPADRAPFRLADVKDYMPEYDSLAEIEVGLLRQPLRQIVLASAAETWKSGLTRYSEPAMAFPPAFPGQNPADYRRGLQQQLNWGAARAYATLIHVERAIAIYDQAASLPGFSPKTEYKSEGDDYQEGLAFQNKQLAEEEKAEPEEKAPERKSRRAKRPDRDAVKKLQRTVDVSLLEQVYQQEESKRWKAWCDLNLGRLLAVSVRLQEYLIVSEAICTAPNALLPTTNSIRFSPSGFLNGGEFTQKRAELARKLLQRCIDNNPNTPWSVMAKAELDLPFGIQVNESFVPPPVYRGPVQFVPFVKPKPVILPNL